MYLYVCVMAVYSCSIWSCSVLLPSQSLIAPMRLRFAASHTCYTLCYSSHRKKVAEKKDVHLFTLNSTAVARRSCQLKEGYAGRAERQRSSGIQQARRKAGGQVDGTGRSEPK